MFSRHRPLLRYLLLLIIWSIPCQQICRAAPQKNQQHTAHLHAEFIHKAPVLDGRLGEAVWQRAPVAADFTQRQPDEGCPAIERTEVGIQWNQNDEFVDVPFAITGRRHHSS